MATLAFVALGKTLKLANTRLAICWTGVLSGANVLVMQILSVERSREGASPAGIGR